MEVERKRLSSYQAATFCSGVAQSRNATVHPINPGHLESTLLSNAGHGGGCSQGSAPTLCWPRFSHLSRLQAVARIAILIIIVS